MKNFYLEKKYLLFTTLVKTFVILITFSTSNKVYSSERKFSINDQKISLYYPKNWQYAYNFLSTPLTLFGPVKKGKRPVISITNSTVFDFEFDRKKLSANQEEYKKGRLKWLKKNKGKFVRFSGYRISKWKHIKEVHSIGYSYTIGDDLYLEKSYFLNCNRNLYNITTLMTWEQNKAHSKEMKKIITSLKCLKNKS